MEGLFIARIVEELRRRLPARNLGWGFPDEASASLLLEPAERSAGSAFNLVLNYRPPAPTLYLVEGAARRELVGEPRTPFQRSLAARARGDLARAEQLKLDRVVRLEFERAPGFKEAPPLRLVVELTGRNANLIALEPDPDEPFGGLIHGAAREIAASRNRFRQVRVGGRYTPPPPYEKVDPRAAPDLAAAVAGLPVERWHTRVDGLGPTLAAEVARRAGVGSRDPLDGPALERAVGALRDVARDPSVSGGTETLSEQARDRSLGERAQELRRALREPLVKRLTLLGRQLEDVQRAREAALDALVDREKADALLAFSRDVPAGAATVRLPNLYGEGDLEVQLDPALDAAANANRLYARARRREDVARRLETREPELMSARRDTEALLAHVEASGLRELEGLIEAARAGREAPPAVGARYRTRGGFEVLVGRNARENDLLTHRIARPTDFWLHAQGYPGSHVILRSGGREVPFSDVLEAAALAAHHSRARGSSNVPVDYAPARQVWRPRGARAGAVYFSGQKTVFVDPAVPGQDAPA